VLHCATVVLHGAAECRLHDLKTPDHGQPL
jgi:hypothetical protein